MRPIVDNNAERIAEKLAQMAREAMGENAAVTVMQLADGEIVALPLPNLEGGVALPPLDGPVAYLLTLFQNGPFELPAHALRKALMEKDPENAHARILIPGKKEVEGGFEKTVFVYEIAQTM